MNIPFFQHLRNPILWLTRLAKHLFFLNIFIFNRAIPHKAQDKQHLKKCIKAQKWINLPSSCLKGISHRRSDPRLRPSQFNHSRRHWERLYALFQIGLHSQNGKPFEKFRRSNRLNSYAKNERFWRGLKDVRKRYKRIVRLLFFLDAFCSVFCCSNCL